MSPKGYLSHSVAIILQALENGYRYGFEIMDVTGLPSGTVYPALRRLEENGLVISKWEKGSIALREQRPSRKYYEVTAGGKRALAEAVSRYRLLEGLVPQAPPRTDPTPKRGRG